LRSGHGKNIRAVYSGKGKKMAFRIIREDITKIKADAIVNTANPDPVFMAGTDRAVYLAAGADELLKERKKIGRIEEGQVEVTGAFDLPAKYIFHTVGPVWQGGDKGEAEIVRSCYENCLNKALELNIGSIAFPLIATGTYGFPRSEALQIATSVFSSFLSENEMDITLAVFDGESFTLSGKIFAGIDRYIDDNYVEEKINEEYAFAGRNHYAGAGIPEPEEYRGSVEKDGKKAGCRPDEKTGPRSGERNRRNFLEGLLRKRDSVRMQEETDRCMAEPSYQRSLDDVVKNLQETWSQSLLRMITERGYEDTEVYKRANVDRKLFSKIRSNKDYRPKKNTAVAFALALRLNMDEARDFIGRAGYAFSPSNRSDLIVEYFIENGVYDLMTINIALFDHDEPLLG